METIFIIVLCIVLFTHWLADFVFQTDEMAQGKSKSIYWLSIHITSYFTVSIISLSFCFLIFGISVEPYLLIGFVFLNSLLHWIIDYFTSRWSSKLYSKGEIHNFFVVIGFDQLLHTLLLIVTSYYILGV